MRFSAIFLLSCPPGKSHPQVYQEGIEQMAAAEALGFHTVWLTEHHFSAYGGSPDPMLMAIAAAHRTTTVRIGIGVSVLPFHHPLQLAEQGAMVDVLSGGRLEFGVGRGSQRYEYERLGVSMDDKGARFEEALEIIRKAWVEEAFAYEGSYYRFPETTVYPRVLQRPHPPVWIASTTPPTLRYAVKYRCPVMGSALLTLPRAKEYWALYQSLLAEDGQDPASAVFALSRRMYVAEDTRHVRQAAERCVAFHYTWAKQMGIAKSGPHGDLSFDELFDSSYIFGTADECVAMLSELRAIGIQEVICNMNFAGVLESHQVLDSMQLFAAKVMPQLV
jgi:alkanesulfonate monooxygenase SsuD/methylene tetrahydromethanopterin reductase-like flavin-dependent oxidoreductase (luciferase family)